MHSTAIRATGLKKSFQETPVLKQVDFEVREGEVFALLGANGAGKTTTIKILTTLLRPDGGEASVSGFDVVRQPEQVRERISLTGQFSAVDTLLTGRENLRMIGKLRHLPDAAGTTEKLLRQFNLRDAADRPVGTYSGGMRRRLDLAMSLTGDPPILFLDEPTTGLDPQSRIAVWKQVECLVSGGRTVFLTTQYLEEADRLANHIAILHEGRIMTQGTAAELKKLLPSGNIRLRFYDETAMRQAAAVLGSYRINLDLESMAVDVPTDGSARQTADVLNRLEAAEIAVAEFAQKPPTLEDVFLTFTGGKEDQR